MGLAARLMGKIDTRVIIAVGFVIFAVSLRQMAAWSLQMDFWPVIISGFIQGIGMGLVFVPLNSLAFATLGGNYRTDGASLLNLMRSVGQSAGISLATSLLARNLQQSHADLATHITANTIPSLDASALNRYGVIADGVFAFADSMINQQAAMIAYLDDFYLMSWISIVVVPLVFLLSKPKGKLEAIHAE
jgi:DHA2 family multidrug resistance protein